MNIAIKPNQKSEVHFAGVSDSQAAFGGAFSRLGLAGMLVLPSGRTISGKQLSDIGAEQDPVKRQAMLDKLTGDGRITIANFTNFVDDFVAQTKPSESVSGKQVVVPQLAYNRLVGKGGAYGANASDSFELVVRPAGTPITEGKPAPAAPTPAAPPAPPSPAKTGVSSGLSGLSGTGFATGVSASGSVNASSGVPPVGRFSPSPGIVIDRTGNSISITGVMEVYGPEATPERAAQIQRSINEMWTQTFPNGYSVSCNIVVRYRAPGSSADSNATQIEAKKTLGPSHVSPGLLGGRSMTLNANEGDVFTWTPAHEFGHIIGLKDRYSESIMSKIKGMFGGDRSTPANAGYGSNVMGASGGTLESQNVDNVATENAPSPYWINDDDQIRDWVSSHSLADIGRLSTADKLKAIKILQGGWISGADMAAMHRICQSVTSHSEAEAIRAGVDTNEFSDLGQRTDMRVYMSQMP